MAAGRVAVKAGVCMVAVAEVVPGMLAEARLAPAEGVPLVLGAIVYVVVLCRI